MHSSSIPNRTQPVRDGKEKVLSVSGWLQIVAAVRTKRNTVLTDFVVPSSMAELVVEEEELVEEELVEQELAEQEPEPAAQRELAEAAVTAASRTPRSVALPAVPVALSVRPVLVLCLEVDGSAARFASAASLLTRRLSSSSEFDSSVPTGGSSPSDQVASDILEGPPRPSTTEASFAVASLVFLVRSLRDPPRSKLASSSLLSQAK